MAKKSSTEKEIEKNPESENRKDKSQSAKGSNSKNSIENLKQYFKDSFNELKKIQWPTRKQATGETIVVLITVIFLTALVYFTDNFLSWIFSFIYE